MNDASSGEERSADGARPSETEPTTADAGDSPLSRKTRIFVVDDHPIVRRGLQMLLSLQPDMQVCGDAVGVKSAEEGIGKVHPEVVIVDLALEDGNGFELLEWLRREHPQIKALVFTSHEDRVYAERAIKAGALGYVLKYDGTQELMRAIRAVMQDRPYISKKFAQEGLLANRRRHGT